MQREVFDNIAVCGYDCSQCPAYKATLRGDAEALRKVFTLPPDAPCSVEKDGCLGCKSSFRNEKVCDCHIRKCNSAKKQNSCAECATFPCDYLKNNLSAPSLARLGILRKKRQD